MWKMLEPDFECGNECGGPGPPPEFLIPPPPRPPFLGELIKCSEDNPLPNSEMCDAIPILDASFHSSPSLQTSAMIILCSVILVLVILISSLLVWKHKRKVQNFLPCKTPTRGHPLGGNGVVGGHSVTYEDPDVHMGHHPLVMRHHHNIEMIHPKAIHYPSGYPISRTPPLFVCSSPGPDPYRSNDNVYEELGPPRDSDGESDPPLHSDDDFAEDELSLPGERSFQKSSPDTTVATIYHETNRTGTMTTGGGGGVQTGGNSGSANGSGGSSGGSSVGGNNLMERQLNERNSLLSSSSSTTNDNNRSLLRNNSSPVMFRSRKIYNRENNNRKLQQNYSADELNTSAEQQQANILPPTTAYNERVNIMTLPYPNTNLLNNNINNNTSSQHPNNLIVNNSCNNLINNNNGRLSGGGGGGGGGVGIGDDDGLIDRRNHINTIYRDRNFLNQRIMPSSPTTQQHHIMNSNQRSRTQPRSRGGNNRTTTNTLIENDPNYGYTEPVFHEGILYDSCLTPHHPNTIRPPIYHHPYILPEFTSFRSLNNHQQHHHPMAATDRNCTNPTQIYARGDSSFGSDSGYSQHTQSSNRGGGSGGGGAGGFIGATFGWGRRSKNKNNKNGTYNGS